MSYAHSQRSKQEQINVFANVKNKNVGEILSIDEKLEKYTETTSH